jgi:hypothetical protein
VWRVFRRWRPGAAATTLHNYEIHIAGPVPADVAAELDDAWISPRGVETVMPGFVPDQAALVGIINWLQGLGVELREVRQIEDVGSDRE